MGDSPAQQGGLGLDFSKLQLKPATININQPNTQVEGAVRGKLRISENGLQYDEMRVTLLEWPHESRSYYTGTGMNRRSENLVCFSRDMVRPDPAAKEQQALYCDGCVHSDWTKYRESRDRADAPACQPYVHAMFIDTNFKMPLQMYVRSTNIKPFKNGLDNLKRTLFMVRSQGIMPNVFDISFKLSTKRIETRGLPSYILQMSDFKAITPEEREEFGVIYTNFFNRKPESAEHYLEADNDADQIEAAAQTINRAAVGVGTFIGDVTV